MIFIDLETVTVVLLCEQHRCPFVCLFIYLFINSTTKHEKGATQ